MRGSVEDRIWYRVVVTDACWIWVGGLGHGGRYGAVTINGKEKAVHRVLYEQANGPVPEGLKLDHLCRNPTCVRPDHLEAVTHLENMRRGLNATRLNCRKGHPLTRTRIGRVCRTCRQESNRAYRRRLAGAA